MELKNSASPVVLISLLHWGRDEADRGATLKEDNKLQTS